MNNSHRVNCLSLWMKRNATCLTVTLDKMFFRIKKKKQKNKQIKERKLWIATFIVKIQRVTQAEKDCQITWQKELQEAYMKIKQKSKAKSVESSYFLALHVGRPVDYFGTNKLAMRPWVDPCSGCQECWFPRHPLLSAHGHVCTLLICAALQWPDLDTIPKRFTSCGLCMRTISTTFCIYGIMKRAAIRFGNRISAWFVSFCKDLCKRFSKRQWDRVWWF